MMEYISQALRSIILYLKNIAEGTDKIDVSVKLDDTNIADIKTNTDTIKTDDADIKSKVSTIKDDVATVKADIALMKASDANIDTNVGNIYTLLDERLVKKLWITRADYDQLVLDDEVDSETLYIVIESQSNPNP